jgi:hypothetical protein
MSEAVREALLAVGRCQAGGEQRGSTLGARGLVSERQRKPRREPRPDPPQRSARDWDWCYPADAAR